MGKPDCANHWPLACVMGFWGWQWTVAPQGDAASQGTVRIDNQRNNDSD